MNLFKITFLSTFLILGGISFAQAQSFTEGQNGLSLGAGAGNFAQSLFEIYESETGYNYSRQGPFFLKYENAVADNIGFGLQFAYIGAKVKWTSITNFVAPGVPLQQEVNWVSWSLLARMNIHFGDSEKFDPYWGFGMGYRDGKTTTSDNDPDEDHGVEINSPFNFGLETTLGARYFFTDDIGAYVEAGFSKAIIQGGLVVRI